MLGFEARWRSLESESDGELVTGQSCLWAASESHPVGEESHRVSVLAGAGADHHFAALLLPNTLTLIAIMKDQINRNTRVVARE